MGFVYDQHGRVTIETRRESFKIHAEYRGVNFNLGEWWATHTHPEFLLDDLDDLIAALQEARAADSKDTA